VHAAQLLVWKAVGDGMDGGNAAQMRRLSIWHFLLM
jgi:hypothetical protein